MKENKEVYSSLLEIVNTIRSFLRYLAGKWWLLLLTIVAVIGLGVFYYSKQKSKYEAVTTFVLEEKSSGGGGLAGLASQFGLNLGSLSGGGSIFAGDNILNILKSKKVVYEVLLSKLNSADQNDKTLGDLYLEFTGLKNSWEKKLYLNSFTFNSNPNKVTPLQDSILNIIYGGIIKDNLSAERLSKQGSIIKVKITAANALFARLISERLVETASKLYIDIRVGTAQENINQLQRRADSLLILLNNKSYNVAIKQPLDINPGIRSAIVPVEIATRDKTIIATLYAEVVKNLEASKLLLSQYTPVIQLLDRPEYLLKDKRRSAAFLLVVFEAMFLFVFISIAFLLFYFKSKLQPSGK